MGRYALATMPCVVNGLHSVRFMVIEPITGVVLSVGEQKTQALDAARSLIQASEQLALESQTEGDDEVWQATLWPAEELPVTVREERRKPVSKRRRDIFAKCRGSCHYCSTPLQLAGPWHVEHMLPRALGGLDEVGNLVAACVPCNLSKGDRTAIEFVTRQKSAK